MFAKSRTIREVEIKLRIADLSALRRQIGRLNASFHGRVFEQNVLYDTPDSDFRRRGRLLRLRTETPALKASVIGTPLLSAKRPSRAILTSKFPTSPAKPCPYKEKLETESIVSNPAAWRRAIRSLGLREGFRYEKYRTSYRLRAAHLDLDETPVGTFLEIEGPALAIDAIARQLGFSPRNYIRATYWDLYAADCRRRGRKLRNMLFGA